MVVRESKTILEATEQNVNWLWFLLAVGYTILAIYTLLEDQTATFAFQLLLLFLIGLFLAGVINSIRKSSMYQTTAAVGMVFYGCYNIAIGRFDHLSGFILFTGAYLLIQQVWRS